MTKFILRTAFLVFIISIILLILEFFIFFQVKNPFSIKKNILKSNISKTETLILGNSHLYYGLNPKFFSSYAINLASRGRKIETDYFFLKENIKNIKNIKNVIIPISFYTLYASELSEGEKRLFYNYFDINKYNQGFIKNLLLNEPINETYKDFTSWKLRYGDIDSLGFRIRKKTYVYDAIGIENLKKIYSKLDTLNTMNINRNLNFLKEIVTLTHQNNVKLTIIFPPCHQDFYQGYLKKIVDKEIHIIKKTLSDSVIIINATRFFEKENTFFCDSHHLNQKGAIFFSKKVDSILSINLK